MTKILSIDTCLNSCSVAIHEEGKLIGESFLDVGLTHSETLVPMVQFLLNSAGMTVNDIDVLGVTSGPGSFTGLRIGMATVKGLAFASDIPCVTISSLHALALGAACLDGIVCPCIDARNNQIYNAVFKAHGGKIERIVKNRAINIDDFVDKVGEYEDKIIFIGDGAQMCYNNAIKIFNKDNMLYFSEEFSRIRAGKIGGEIFKRYKSGIKYSYEEIVPEYIKLSQAERMLKSKDGDKI